jgi:hypothetical protein
MEDPHLDRPQNEIASRCESETQLETNVTTIWCLAGMQGNGSNPPDL